MMRTVEGIGIGLRDEFARALPDTHRRVDWLEITPENWVKLGRRGQRILDACAERWPIVPHGVSLSIGGPDPLDAAFLDAIDALCKRVGAPWWSDHICYATLDGAYVNRLLPLPFHEEAMEHAAARIHEVRRRVETPLALENPTFYAEMPGATMTEAAFLRGVVERGACDLLLDVNNVVVNAKNHGSDPRRFVDDMPLARVRQIHVAGHATIGDLVIDTHDTHVPDEVWDLYRHTLSRAGRLIPTLIEWDANIPSVDAVLDEVDRAREHARIALGGPS